MPVGLPALSSSLHAEATSASATGAANTADFLLISLEIDRAIDTLPPERFTALGPVHGQRFGVGKELQLRVLRSATLHVSAKNEIVTSLTPAPSSDMTNRD